MQRTFRTVSYHRLSQASHRLTHTFVARLRARNGAVFIMHAADFACALHTRVQHGDPQGNFFGLILPLCHPMPGVWPPRLPTLAALRSYDLPTMRSASMQ